MGDISLLPGGEGERLRPGAIITQRVELGVQASLGAAHGLRGLTAGWIGPVAMHLDVHGIAHQQPVTRAPLEPFHDGNFKTRPRTAERRTKEAVDGDGKRQVAAPFKGGAVLYLHTK